MRRRIIMVGPGVLAVVAVGAGGVFAVGQLIPPDDEDLGPLIVLASPSPAATPSLPELPAPPSPEPSLLVATPHIWDGDDDDDDDDPDDPDTDDPDDDDD